MNEEIGQVLTESIAIAHEKGITIEYLMDDGLQYVSLKKGLFLADIVKELMRRTVEVMNGGVISLEFSGRQMHQGFEIFTGVRVKGNVNLIKVRDIYNAVDDMVAEHEGQFRIKADRAYFLIPVELKDRYDTIENVGKYIKLGEEARQNQQHISYQIEETESLAETGKSSYEEGTFSGGLPELPEFDWNTALGYLGDTELVMETLAEFYKSIDKEIAMYENWLPEIDKPEVLAQFRVKVHALKSTAKLLGANMLSGLARKGELTAINEDSASAKAMIPIILDELRHHKDIISEVVPQEEPKGDFDQAKLKEIMIEVAEAADDMEIDILDEKKASINEMSIPEQYASKVSEIVTAIDDIEFDKAMELAKELLSVL